MTTPGDFDERLLAHYPVLQSIEQGERQSVLGAEARHLVVPAELTLFEEGQPCQGFPFVLAGEIRVARGSPGGRSLELYRVVPGEMCVVSTSCLFGSVPLTAHGRTVAETELVMLSVGGFERLTAFESFRRYVFGVCADRLAELMELAEAVAFQRLDQRLANALLGHGPVVGLTHQALADELGTVREVVTRLLRRFERAGWITLARERISIVDAPALRALSESAGAV